MDGPAPDEEDDKGEPLLDESEIIHEVPVGEEGRPSLYLFPLVCICMYACCLFHLWV